MKKYIAPIVLTIDLSTENSILAGSEISTINNVQSTGAQLSNKRDASSTIWGFDDEAE